MKRGVFLDRDGTLIEEVGYLDRLERVRFFPYSVDAVRLLNRAGFVVIVARTRRVSRAGSSTRRSSRRTHRSLARQLEAGGARVDGFYYCPHHPEGGRRGLPAGVRLPQAAAGPAAARRGRSSDRPSSTRSSSATAGTTSRPGPAVGARGVLVRTGYGDRVRTLRATAPRRSPTTSSAPFPGFCDNRDRRRLSTIHRRHVRGRRSGATARTRRRVRRVARRRLRRSHRRRVHLRRARRACRARRRS